MKVGLDTMPVIPFEVSDGFFQVAENTALALYNTAAQHTVPRFEDSKWTKMMEAQSIEEEAREVEREAKIRARLDRIQKATSVSETLSED